MPGNLSFFFIHRYGTIVAIGFVKSSGPRRPEEEKGIGFYERRV